MLVIDLAFVGMFIKVCSGLNLAFEANSSIELSCDGTKNEVIEIKYAFYGARMNGSWSDYAVPSDLTQCSSNQTTYVRMWCDGRTECSSTIIEELFSSTCEENAEQGVFLQYYCIDACPETMWGEACEHNCSKSCEDQRCDAVTGECLTCPVGMAWPTCQTNCSGWEECPECLVYCLNSEPVPCENASRMCRCSDGYRPPTCRYECANQTYGENCSLECSRSCVASECHHITGACMLGCASGYYGIYCEESDREPSTEHEYKDSLQYEMPVFALICAFVYFLVMFNVNRDKLSEDADDEATESSSMFDLYESDGGTNKELQIKEVQRVPSTTSVLSVKAAISAHSIISILSQADDGPKESTSKSRLSYVESVYDFIKNEAEV